MVNNHYRWDFIGLSTDEKPTPETSEKVVDGSTFYCSDTSTLYVFCKDNWYERKALGDGGGGSSINVVQTTGTSTTDVMSQNAVTKALANAGGGGVAKVLTSSDYNWPVSNPDGVALWLLDSGLYTVTDNSVKVYGRNNSSYALSDFNNFLVTNGVNGLNKNLSYIYEFRHDFADINKNVITYSIIKRDDGSQYESGGQILTSRYTVDNLGSYNPIQPLSANQGRILNDKITALEARVAALEGN